MTMSDTGTMPHKISVRIDKHFDGDTSHAPDEVHNVEQWYEADGSIVTDPERIRELEAKIARKD